MAAPRLLTALLLSLALPVGAAAPAKPMAGLTLKVFPVDPLINVFKDTPITTSTAASADGTTPALSTPAHADAARGEHATWQLVVTSQPVALRELECHVTPFTLATGDATITGTTTRFVGYVPASRGAAKPASDRLRPSPAEFPDPLLEGTIIDVHANANQPIWLSAKIPETARPGTYTATAEVSASLFGRPHTTTVPLTLQVYPATINKTRLNVTMWYQMWHHEPAAMPAKFSEPYWDLLRSYIRNMVAHRQNWARVETLWVMGFGKGSDGKITFDFTNFDRWMNILFEEGIQNVEGLQFAWRRDKWDGPYVVEVYREEGTTWTKHKVLPDDPEAIEFYSRFFPALQSHLKEKGWADKYVQHVGDEPESPVNISTYTTASQLLKKYAPGMKVMEACLASDLVGAIDIWVPKLDDLHKKYEFFKQREAAGDGLWFYTCVSPQGEYANRFVELPLIKTRLLHWINFKYNIDGYLHWGYNFWRPRPWDNCAEPGLPGGDMAIVYPKKNSLGIVESIRYEAMRDGIEDHELLSQLKEKDPAAAQRLADKHILDFDKYDTDPARFRETRKQLLEALSVGNGQ